MPELDSFSCGISRIRPEIQVSDLSCDILSKFSLLRVALLLAIVLFSSIPVYSCDCFKGTVEGNFQGAAVVFQGTPIFARTIKVPIAFGLNINDTSIAPYFENTEMLYTFSVLKTWKGITHKNIYIASDLYEGACGRSFVLGKSYVVFAFKDRIMAVPEFNGLVTTICDHTQPISDAQNAINVLGDSVVLASALKGGFQNSPDDFQGFLPAESDLQTPPFWGVLPLMGMVYLWVYSRYLVVAIAVFVVAYFIRRRFRQHRTKVV